MAVIWSTMDQKTSQKGHFSGRIIFTLLLSFADVFGHGLLFQTAKMRSYSKGPDHAMEKFLTNETPSMYLRLRAAGAVWLVALFNMRVFNLRSVGSRRSARIIL